MPVYKDENVKKNPWFYVLEIGKGKNRKRTKKRGFKTKKEAQAALVEAENNVNNGTFIKREKTLLPDLMYLWLKTKEHSLADVTYKTYGRHISLHINEYFEEFQAMDLTDEDCLDFIKHLRVEKELASRSVKDVFKVLRSALDWAVLKSKLQRNVTRLIDMPAVERQEIMVWDADQVREFDKNIREHHDYIAFLLAYGAGLRQSEALAVRLKDVNYESNTISIVQTLSHDGKKIRTGAKTASGTRLVSVDETIIKEIQKRKRVIAAEKLKAGGVYQDNDLIVATSVGTPVTPRNLLRTFYRYMEKLDIPKITIHDLRHTHATLLLKQGVHPKIVQERLGHASVKITIDLYSHVLPNMQKETAERFGDFLFGTNSGTKNTNGTISAPDAENRELI